MEKVQKKQENIISIGGVKQDQENMLDENNKNSSLNTMTIQKIRKKKLEKIR